MNRRAAIVLHLHQAQRVRINRSHRFNDLRTLTLKFIQVVGTPAVGGGNGGAQGAALPCLTRGRVAIGEGGEKIQHVEAGHFDIATDRFRFECSGVGSGERGHHSGLNFVITQARCAVGGQAEIDHTGDAASGIASAGHTIRTRVRRRVGVLQRGAIIQNDASAGVFIGQCIGLRAGAVAVGGRFNATIHSQRQLTIATLEEVLLHREGPGQLHQHAFKALQLALHRFWQRHHGRGNHKAAVDEGDRRDAGELRHRSRQGVGVGGRTGVELGNGSRHLHQVAHLRSRIRRRAGEDEDAV